MNPNKNYHILVVDDDKKICDLFTVFIKIGHKNVNCVVANDSTQASFKLENQEFDLIFVDYMLPGKSGLELVRHLRRTNKHKKKPIVLMSGAIQKQDVLSAMESGVNEILIKPFTFAQVMEKVRGNLVETY